MTYLKGLPHRDSDEMRAALSIHICHVGTVTCVSNIMSIVIRHHDKLLAHSRSIAPKFLLTTMLVFPMGTQSTPRFEIKPVNN